MFLNLNAKLLKRFLLIFAGSLYQWITPIGNLLTSIFIVRIYSAALWGGFVSISLLVNFAAHIMNWGQRDYVLREISQSPARLSEIWQANAMSRLPLAIGFVVIVSAQSFEPAQKMAIILWGLILYWQKLFEPLILYRKYLHLAAIVELISYIVFLAALAVFLPDLAVYHLLWATLVAGFFKGLAYAYYFRPVFSELKFRFEARRLADGFDFFLPGWVGLLQSRLDLYCVALFLTESELGIYHILTNFLIQLRELACVRAAPMLKHIYRLPGPTVLRLARRIFWEGSLILMVAMLIVCAIIEQVYRLELSPALYGLGYLATWPFFFYYLPTHQIFSRHKPQWVAGVTLLGGIIQLILTLIWLPNWRLEGALLASTISQWLILALFISLQRALVHRAAE